MAKVEGAVPFVEPERRFLLGVRFRSIGWFLFGGTAFEAIAFAGEGDDLGVLQEPVEDRRGGRDVADQLAPVFDRAVGGHDGRADFVPTHDDFEQVLTAPFRQALHAHVVDDQHVRLEVVGHHFFMTVERFVVQEVADRVEDRAIQHRVAATDQVMPDRLGEMALAGAGGPLNKIPRPSLRNLPAARS